MRDNNKNVGEATLDAAYAAYNFETVRVNFPEIQNDSDELLKKVNESKNPSSQELEYIDDFYDRATGTAFKEKETGEIIIAYTGTNPGAGFIETVKDAVLTDGISIGLGQGIHYKPAYEFYEKIQRKYGSENIRLIK